MRSPVVLSLTVGVDMLEVSWRFRDCSEQFRCEWMELLKGSAVKYMNDL